MISIKTVLISASNIKHTEKADSISYRVCEEVVLLLNNRLVNNSCKIIELKKYYIEPCMGCGECYYSNRCVIKDDFNSIYSVLTESDIVIFISPHYAPIPAKLSALLEKMEQITFLKWGKDNSYKSELFGKLTGIISHGGGGQWALDSYKKMVNDTIANAAETIQLEIVPLNEYWTTGISLPVKNVTYIDDNIFPCQEYNWELIKSMISEYTEQIIKEIQRRN